MLPLFCPHQEIRAGFLQLTLQFWALQLSCHDARLVGGNSVCRQWRVWPWRQMLGRGWETSPGTCSCSQGQWGLLKSKGQDFLWRVRSSSPWFAFLSFCGGVRVVHVHPKVEWQVGVKCGVTGWAHPIRTSNNDNIFIFYLKGQSSPFWLVLFFLLAFSFFHTSYLC